MAHCSPVKLVPARHSFAPGVISIPPTKGQHLRAPSSDRQWVHRQKSLCHSTLSKRRRCESFVQASSSRGGYATQTVAENKAIRVKDVELSFDTPRGEKVKVLDRCSLEVPEGALWMLLGPNGCGKSTLLKALAGLLPTQGGHVDVAAPRSFVFQNPDHQVVMPTVGVDVAFGLGRDNMPAAEVRQRVTSSLEAVGMADYITRPVQTLSGGQKQRVAIAGALAEQSQVLLLDELTTFLDEADQVGVLEAVRNIIGPSHRVTGLWVTHRLEELAYADGAAYMELGRVMISGSVSEVQEYIDNSRKSNK